MDDDGNDPSGLDWRLMAEIWKLAVSDRRRMAAQFPFLDRAGLSDDACFYAAVLERMQADPAWCADLERAFQTTGRTKDVQRSFARRAWRWLAGRVEGLGFVDGVITPPPETWPAVARAVFVLWDQAVVGPADDSQRLVETAQSASVDDLPHGPDDWSALVEALSAAVEGMTQPDPLQAQEICALAQRLERACAAHASDEMRRSNAVLAERRAALIDAMAVFNGEVHVEQAMATIAELPTLAALDAATAAAAPLLEAWHHSRETGQAHAEAVAHEVQLKADPATSRPDLRRALDAAEETEQQDNAARAALDTELARFAATLRALMPADTAPVDAPSADGAAPVPGLPNEHGTQDANAAVDKAPNELETLAADDTEDAAEEPVVKVAEGDDTVRGAQAPIAEHASGLALEPQTGDGPAAPQAGRYEGPDVVDRPAKVAVTPVPPSAIVVEPAPAPAQDEPAVWTGRKTLDDLTADYLDSDAVALAWHLADLAEERGLRPPVPAIALKSLLAGTALAGPYDAMTQTLGEWLAAMMSAVEEAETEGPLAGLRARSVALAALLSPALIARDTNAREHLGNLSLADGLSDFAPVVALLRELRHDFQPSLTDLVELAGGEKERRLPAAVKAIKEWLPAARAAQSMHAPSNTILHRLLARTGRLGDLFEAALADQPDQVEAELTVLQALSTEPRMAEDLVAQAEKDAGRPKQDAIRGTALAWLCRKLREGADLLLDWRAARLQDTLLDDRRRETLRRHCNELRKELERVKRLPPADDGVDAAVQRLLDRFITRMLELIDGCHAAPDGRLSQVLAGQILRLPAICQPFSLDQPAYARERGAQRAALMDALSRPESLPTDDQEALRAHIRDAAILPARTLIERMEREDCLSAADAAERRHELENAIYTATATARREMITLRHALEPLQSIDLATSQEIQQWLDRFAVIDQALGATDGITLPMSGGARSVAVPPDFPQLRAVLAEAQTLRETVQARILAEQKHRLDGLILQLQRNGNHGLAAEATEISATLSQRDPLTVEDILIRLQNGQSPSLSGEAQDDHFAAFYPGFVATTGTEPEVSAIKTAIGAGTRAGPLDYAALEDHDRKRALDLVEDWRRVVNAMGRGRDLPVAVRGLMERLGFTSVVIERESILSGQLRWMWMRADVLMAQDWFLPPAFGSEAQGSYPVFLAHRNVEDAQLVTEMAKVGRDQPCILLVAGRLSKARRETFSLAMRRAKQTVLLIDETQILFLTQGGNWMERLFACATPFGYLQPYTTNAGNIPVEMFFGRENEIAKIESTSNDGCLVYGGRQLGKSALLNHVRKRFHQPQIGRRAYYLKIDEFGGEVQPAAQIWTEIRRVLVKDEVLPKSTEGPDDIRAGLIDWLAKGGERRILVLIDEADMFLASEARTRFPNLNPLKDLMEETARRFKVVFAGLHNVRRMAKAPNSPLVHLAEPICIGPLNTSVESSRQARRLAVQPMRAAGFDFEQIELVHALLTRVNFYPSLVQVFLKALLEGLANQPRPSGPGPRWILGRELLFESPYASGINAQIRERFQWTLNLDPRYELIAKVLARHRLLSGDGDGGVMTPDVLRREAEDFWPRGQERLSAVDFPAFLDEMVDLGVLIRLPGGQFGLRGAQIAQMLGQLEQLDDEILKISEKEPRVDYDPSHYHRRARPEQVDRRAPLPDRGMARLFDTARPGPRVLIAAPALYGADLAQIVADLADGWNDASGRLSGEVFRGGDDELRRFVDRAAGRRVLVMEPRGTSAARWLEWLAGHEKVRRGAVLPVLVGAPDVFARLLPPALPEGLVLLRAQPWGRSMLRAWLTETGLTLLDTPEEREALLRISGGVPTALAKLRPSIENLVAQGYRDGMAAQVTQLGQDIGFTAAQVGIPDRLVPLFCELAELVDGDGAATGDVLSLFPDAEPATEAEIARMVALGLLHHPAPETLALSALGGLLYRDFTRSPRGA